MYYCLFVNIIILVTSLINEHPHEDFFFCLFFVSGDGLIDFQSRFVFNFRFLITASLHNVDSHYRRLNFLLGIALDLLPFFSTNHALFSSNLIW